MRQDALLESSDAQSRHFMFINNLELRHSFPPLAGETSCGGNFHGDDSLRCVQKTDSGSLVFGLPSKWCNVSEVLSTLMEAVENNIPPLINEEVSDTGLHLRDNTGSVRVHVEIAPDLHNLSQQTMKMKRLAGNELQYTRICEHLINSMTGT